MLSLRIFASCNRVRGLMLCLALCTPTTAFAETAVMLPATHDARVAQAERLKAADAVAAQLSKEGTTVVSETDARLRMPSQPFRDCASVECAHQVAHTLGADFSVLVTVWAARGSEAASSVAVSLVNPEADAFGGEAAVRGNNVGRAAREALRQARQRQRVGKLAALNVHTQPPGANVVIDGVRVGRTPYRRMLDPGTHVIAVQLPGFREESRTVEMESLEEHTVDLRLSRASMADEDTHRHASIPGRAPTTSVHRERSALNWVFAGTLAVGAVPALVSALRTAANDGDCRGRTDPAGFCDQRVDFGTRSGVLLGVGIAAIAGSVFFALVQPLEVTAHADAHSAHVSGKITF